MTDLVLAPDAPAVVLRPSRARLRIGTGIPTVTPRPFIPVVYPAGHDDVLLVVETPTGSESGETLGEIRGATFTAERWTLNGLGSLGFTMSASNDAMDHFLIPGTIVDGAGVMRLIGREIQHWRDGVLRWAGPPITARFAVDGTAAFDCRDLAWHLFRKFFGGAERYDRLLGIGSMDTPGLPGWVELGATKSRDTFDKARGVASMKLTGSGSVTASFLQPARPVSPVMHLTAVIKVPSGTPIGTTVATIETRTTSGMLVDRASIKVDENTIFDDWQRVTTYAAQRNANAHRVTVTLSSLGDYGTTGFDDVRALENNTTGSPGGTPNDLALHVAAAVNHMQSVGAGQGVGFGITPRWVELSGTTETFGERHLNHQQFADFVAKYTGRADGVDWWMDYDTRQFCISNRRGVDHTNLTLDPRLVRSGGFTHDETNIAAKVVVPGEGDGVDRPEGGYHDASRTAGLTYDDFWQPPANTPLSALDPMARQRWEEVSQPQLSFDGLAISDEHLGVVNPGDTITGTMRIGKARLPFDTPVRIAEVELAHQAGELVLT